MIRCLVFTNNRKNTFLIGGILIVAIVSCIAGDLVFLDSLDITR
jgi:hypothetical protein